MDTRRCPLKSARLRRHRKDYKPPTCSAPPRGSPDPFLPARVLLRMHACKRARARQGACRKGFLFSFLPVCCMMFGAAYRLTYSLHLPVLGVRRQERCPVSRAAPTEGPSACLPTRHTLQPAEERLDSQAPSRRSTEPFRYICSPCNCSSDAAHSSTSARKQSFYSQCPSLSLPPQPVALSFRL